VPIEAEHGEHEQFPDRQAGWSCSEPLTQPLTRLTILSGDIDGNDTGDINDSSRHENAYHVVAMSESFHMFILEFQLQLCRLPSLQCSTMGAHDAPSSCA
jgi:hypothetical protein